MPSWNVHLAHAERLLTEVGASRMGICDVNAFLVGNVVPDIPVGFIVKNPANQQRYTFTHYARKAYVPLPRPDKFWQHYIEGRADVDELTLGSWAHLVADNVYNAHTRAFIKSHRIQPGEQARIDKQDDFALFGRTLTINSTVHVDDHLLAQTSAFEQYDLPEVDVVAAIDAANFYVEENHREHLFELPKLSMLTPDFFTAAWEEAHETILAGLLSRLH